MTGLALFFPMTSTPPPSGPSLDEVVRATTTAVVTAIIELIRALRVEIEGAQASASAFVGAILGGIGRAFQLALRGMRDMVIAIVFAFLGLIVLSIFLVAALNRLLGDPWGTGLTALILLLAAGFFWMRSRAAFAGIEREAQALQVSRK
jgi:hypothetical protein